MNCPTCKNPINDNAMECEWCGASIISPNASIQNNTDLLENKVIELVKKGNILHAVKVVKDAKNISLFEAKEYVENLMKSS